MPNDNPKNDERAKQAFVQHLLARGFERARVTKAPADVTAQRNGRIHYYEVKYTTKSDYYFGAATLTEWQAAIADEDHFRFVVAAERNGEWHFREYTPSEFMEFSSIPPFKVYFNVAVGANPPRQPLAPTKAVKLTRERLKRMEDLYKAFRNE